MDIIATFTKLVDGMRMTNPRMKIVVSLHCTSILLSLISSHDTLLKRTGRANHTP
jgi:hypothetical protein